MAETITAKHHWTAEEFAEMGRAHTRASQGPVARTILHLLSATSMILVAFSFWTMARENFALLGSLIPVYILVPTVFAFIYFGMYANRLLGRWTFRLMPESGKDVEWTFSEGGLEYRTSLTATAYSWALVSKVIEMPKGFLIYKNRFAFDWVPGHAFASTLDARHFARMAEDRSPRYVLVGEVETAESILAGQM